MWAQENRARYDRSKLRYPSDLTDEEWAIMGPLVPPPKPGGNKRTIDVRVVLNGVMYILSTGCQWAALPKDLPPRSTVNNYLRRWDDARTLDSSDHRQPERQGGRKRGACIDPSGYDAGKKIKGKKRHVLVDTQGLLMQAAIHAADIQDRDGGVLLMGTLFGLYPFLLKPYADSGCQGAKFQAGLRKVLRQVNVEIVRRNELHKFVVLPKRGIVELSLGFRNSGGEAKSVEDSV